MCQKHDTTITSECSKLAATSYNVHWNTQPGGIHHVQGHIQTDQMVNYNKPDIVIIDRTKREGIIIDKDIATDVSIRDKEWRG